MTLLADAPRSATNGRSREHSGAVPDDWFRSSWVGTPVSVRGTAPTLQHSFAQFSDAFDQFREHDLVRVVTTQDDYGLVLSSILRGMEPSSWLVTLEVAAGEEASSGDVADALTTFEALRSELGLNRIEMLSATRVKPRTYHSWKKGGTTRPRLTSLRGLWDLADTLEELREVVPIPLGEWFRADGTRRRLLTTGEFADLLDLANNIHVRSERRKRSRFEPGGIVYDEEVPLDRAPLGDIYELGESEQ